MASNMIDTLDHVCIVPGSARINDHPVPAYWECRDCGSGGSGQYKLRVTKPTAEKLGLIQTDGKVLCPNCNQDLEYSGDQHFAELHADICVDDEQHIPQRFQDGELSVEQYTGHFNSLTYREKLGQFERIPTHHIMIKLTAADLSLEAQDPVKFQQLVHDKLVARLEIDAHYVLQHRYQHTTRRADHLVKHFTKSPGGQLGAPATKQDSESK